MKNKIILNHRRLKAKIGALKGRGKRIVFTNGCFDVIHLGHIRYLAKAKSLGDFLVVGVNSDKSVKVIKGKNRPINDESCRLEVLAGLEAVDFVTIFNDATPEKLILSLKPDILVKGADWKVKDIVGSNFVKAYGGRVIRVAYLKGFSTSNLIKKIVKAK